MSNLRSVWFRPHYADRSPIKRPFRDNAASPSCHCWIQVLGECDVWNTGVASQPLSVKCSMKWVLIFWHYSLLNLEPSKWHTGISCALTMQAIKVMESSFCFYSSRPVDGTKALLSIPPLLRRYCTPANCTVCSIFCEKWELQHRSVVWTELCFCFALCI